MKKYSKYWERVRSQPTFCDWEESQQYDQQSYCMALPSQHQVIQPLNGSSIVALTQEAKGELQLCIQTLGISCDA